MASDPKCVVIVGMGPAGLFAAETLAQQGVAVTLYDAMPSPARKFLMAGRGGLNLTHSEDFETFLSRYDHTAPLLETALRAFPPTALMDWVHGLGIETFVGSSGRVFPTTMKASPLLRAWLARLDVLGVERRLGARWTGFSQEPSRALHKDDDVPIPELCFETRAGDVSRIKTDGVILALGGASWPRLGSTGDWQHPLADAGVALTPLVPANCGITIPWSAHVRDRYAGAPLKRIAVEVHDGDSQKSNRFIGEGIITTAGLEGGVIYAAGAAIREALACSDNATLHIDLKPNVDIDALRDRVMRPRGRASLSNHLRKTANLSPAAIALIHEAPLDTGNADAIARRIKDVSLPITGLAPITRAISTAGGVAFDALNEDWMVTAMPGLFVAGEMVDWSAPTGGYLLQGCFASGRAAALGWLRWRQQQRPSQP